MDKSLRCVLLTWMALNPCSFTCSLCLVHLVLLWHNGVTGCLPAWLWIPFKRLQPTDEGSLQLAFETLCHIGVPASHWQIHRNRNSKSQPGERTLTKGRGSCQFRPKDLELWVNMHCFGGVCRARWGGVGAVVAVFLGACARKRYPGPWCLPLPADHLAVPVLVVPGLGHGGCLDSLSRFSDHATTDNKLWAAPSGSWNLHVFQGKATKYVVLTESLGMFA